MDPRAKCGHDDVPRPRGVRVGKVAERLRQHAVEPELARIAELLDPDRHVIMAGRGLGPIGADPAVPPAKIEAGIAVRLARRKGMMHAVHLGVTMIQRITRSSAAGRRTLPWLNIEVALSSTSKTSTGQRRRPCENVACSLVDAVDRATHRAKASGCLLCRFAELGERVLCRLRDLRERRGDLAGAF